MAAEVARAAGFEVDVYEAKGSVGRKFLNAGKGGLNLTHSDGRLAFMPVSYTHLATSAVPRSSPCSAHSRRQVARAGGSVISTKW